MLALLLGTGGGLLVLVLGQLSVPGGDTTYLRELLTSRMRTETGLGAWLGRVFELHWRDFGLTSALGLSALAYRAACGLRSRVVDSAVEVGLIFLVAGLAYVAVFNSSAAVHDYWQCHGIKEEIMPIDQAGVFWMKQGLTSFW